MADILYFVIPCYNEEEVLPLTAKKTGEKLQSLINRGLAAKKSRILFVDDGSKDKTWPLIQALSRDNPIFTGIKLSRNKGHQNALLAGLMAARNHADAVISMDADMQDDIHAVDEFLSAYYQGCNIVYGVRKKRDADSFFKRTTAEGFYRLMRVMGVELVFNHADYRLMDKKALDCLEQYPETNLFLRGIVPQIGLKSTCVYYERGVRAAGESKYPLRKMLALAFDGISSFSVKPLRFIGILGAFIFGIGAVCVLYALIAKLFGASTGWMGVVSSLWVLGGIELLSLGLIGGYIGRIYAQVKNRPRYFVEKSLENEPDSLRNVTPISKIMPK